MRQQNLEELEVATLAGGCFWCMVSPFKTLEGVEEVVSGYTGGQGKDPTYKQVSTGDTGHFEAVQIYFRPELTTYEEILEVYWRQIDPTDPGGQFADRGSQYRTAIFYHNKTQQEIAENSKRKLDESDTFENRIVTKILPFKEFYPAEQHHQDYHEKRPSRYNSYKELSGRAQFLEEKWGQVNNDDRPEEQKLQDFSKPSDEVLKRDLASLQYEVTQHGATETPFQNEYWDNEEKGIYVDIVSGEPLFSSKDKFRSGSGWPSFTRPLVPTNIVEIKETSAGMVRTEIKSKHGDSHLGHVFNDGPEPTGRRYCVNSASLDFIPADQLDQEGYEEFSDLFA